MGKNDYFIGRDIGRLQAEISGEKRGCGCGAGRSGAVSRPLTAEEKHHVAALCEVSDRLRDEFNKVIRSLGLELQISEFGLVSLAAPVSAADRICACCPGLGPGNASYRCCFSSGCDPCDVSISMPDHDEGPGPAPSHDPDD